MKKRLHSVMATLLPVRKTLTAYRQPSIPNGLPFTANTTGNDATVNNLLSTACHQHHSPCTLPGQSPIRYHASLSSFLRLLALVPVCLVAAPLSSQSLQIGDSLPAIPLSHIIHAPFTTSNTQQFKGKTLLFDFFATWCSACVKSLPKLDSIQQQHKEDLQVVMVAYETQHQLELFFARHTSLPVGRLMFITGDTLLGQYFPHRYIPHVIWVNRRGIISAITGSEAVTAAAVGSFVQTGNVKVPEKKDIISYDTKKSLADNRLPAYPAELLSNSTLCRYIDGIGSREGAFKSNGHTRYYFINRPLLILYQHIFGFPSNYVWIDAAIKEDCTGYYENPEAWRKRIAYSYELTVADTVSRQQVMQQMLYNLNHTLHLNGRMENREVNCYALVRTGKEIRKETRLSADKDSFYILQNKSMAYLLELLNQCPVPMPDQRIILDETGYTGTVTLQLPKGDWDHTESLIKALTPYGLTLQKVRRTLPLFVLSPQP